MTANVVGRQCRLRSCVAGSSDSELTHGTVTVHVCDCQSELVSPVEAALEHYVQLHDEIEVDKQTDDDVHVQQQQHQLLTSGSITGKTHIADKASSIDALGFAADYKFKVQKIVARPAVK